MKKIIFCLLFIISTSGIYARIIRNEIPEHQEGKYIESLKLSEAKAQQIDTLPSFKREIYRFRRELAADYLSRNRIEESLVKQEFDIQMHTYDARQIIIPIPLSSTSFSSYNKTYPEDTIASYTDAMLAYEHVLKNKDFEEAVKIFSGDEGTRKHTSSGSIAPNLIKQLPLAVKNELYKMQPGEVSKPIRSYAGYHIIQLRNKERLSETHQYEEIKEHLIKELKKTDASWALQVPSLKKLREVTGFRANDSIYRFLKHLAKKEYPTEPSYIRHIENDTRILFSAYDTAFTAGDFARYLRDNKTSYASLSTDVIEEKLFFFETDKLSKIENSFLEEKYPEFRNTMEEYKKGLLLFEITNQEIREKAVRDTIGLQHFFEEHREKYKWEKPYFKGFVVHCKTQREREKLKEEIAGLPIENAWNYLRETYITKDTIAIKLSPEGLFAQGDDEYVDELIFNTPEEGIAYLAFPFYFVFGKLLHDPEKYTDVETFVLDDYQQQLEKIWIEKLKEKYPHIQ